MEEMSFRLCCFFPQVLLATAHLLRRTAFMAASLSACGFLSLLPPAWAEKAYRADETPLPLRNIHVTERTGHLIDLNLVFTDEKGQDNRLKKYFKGPVLMTVVYYNCPSLCNFHLKGLLEGLDQWSAFPYQFVIVSMDAREKAPLAKEKKTNSLKAFPQLKAENTHFLTGSKDNIKKLTDSLGFAFRWDEETLQFAHSPVAYALSSKGLISRYLYGVEFPAKTLKLALLEAGAGKIGNIMDRILLFCYRFNPKENKYSLYAANIMKAGGLVMVLSLLLLLAPAWIKERRKNA